MIEGDFSFLNDVGLDDITKIALSSLYLIDYKSDV